MNLSQYKKKPEVVPEVSAANEKEELEKKTQAAKQLGNLDQGKVSVPEDDDDIRGEREEEIPFFNEGRIRKVSATRSKRVSKLVEIDRKLYNLYSNTDHELPLTTTISLDEERHAFVSSTAKFLGINIKEMTFLLIDSFKAKYHGKILELSMEDLKRQMGQK